jgi:hypothetical protein
MGSVFGLVLTVAFLAVLFYLARSEDESDDFQEVLGESGHDPELQASRRVVWEGDVGVYRVRILRGNQFAYDDLSLLLTAMTDHDYYLRMETDNVLRRMTRRPVEWMFRRSIVELEEPLDTFMVHTSKPDRARRDLQRWMNEPSRETLSHFHHLVMEPDGSVKARWYPGYPMDDVVEEECYAFVNLLDQFGLSKAEWPDESQEELRIFS